MLERIPISTHWETTSGSKSKLTWLPQEPYSIWNAIYIYIYTSWQMNLHYFQSSIFWTLEFQSYRSTHTNTHTCVIHAVCHQYWIIPSESHTSSLLLFLSPYFVCAFLMFLFWNFITIHYVSFVWLEMWEHVLCKASAMLVSIGIWIPF